MGVSAPTRDPILDQSEGSDIAREMYDLRVPIRPERNQNGSSMP